MTAQLKLSSNWDRCPVPWQNFARSIHSQQPYIQESVFWLIVRVKLRDEFDALIVEGSEYPSYIEFKDDKDLMLFTLRWS